MEQKKITEATIFTDGAWTAEEYKEAIANVRDTVMTLLSFSSPCFKINAQMVGKCIDTLDVLENIKIVDDW